MVYLLAPHASALQMNTTKFKQDFIGPLFIDTALDKTHYRLKDATGLLLDGMYHVNHIKKGSACTPLGIEDKFDTYETALKNTLLNKFAIETPNNKLQEVTLQDGSKELDYLPGTIMDYTTKVVNYRQEDDDANTLLTCTFLNCDEYRTDYDGQIGTTR